MDTNLNTSQPAPQEMLLRVRSVDGSIYVIATRNATDYVLHPEFLRFLIVNCIVYALVRGNADVPGLGGWPLLAVWTMVFTVVLLWLAVSGHFMVLLQKKGVIRLVWTPALLLPLNLIIESSVQGSMYWIADQPLKPWTTTISDLTRDLTILLLLDFLHGHYVVPRHPLAHVSNPRSAEGIGKDAPDLSTPSTTSLTQGTDKPEEPGRLKEAADTTPVSVTGAGHLLDSMQQRSIRIGSQTYCLTDILLIRIEDHYLSVTTRSGKTMERAKLGSIDELHNGTLGIQINRSVWVAFWAIREVQPAQNGQILLTLTNGDEEFVAKPRVFAFRQAYRTATAGAA